MKNEQDATLTIKLPKLEKDAFKLSCSHHDRNMSQELRAFIREFVRQNPPGEPTLFDRRA